MYEQIHLSTFFVIFYHSRPNFLLLTPLLLTAMKIWQNFDVMYYTAGFVLCPGKIDVQVVRAAGDTERVAVYNWAKHVFNATMDDVATVQKAKREGLTNIKLESCPILPQVCSFKYNFYFYTSSDQTYWCVHVLYETDFLPRQNNGTTHANALSVCPKIKGLQQRQALGANKSHY